jgi:hypothetical protein
MTFFIDTANMEVIKDAFELGIISRVTMDKPLHSIEPISTVPYKVSKPF